MNEYMLLIRNMNGSKNTLSKQDHHDFIKHCESYIKILKEQDLLIAAQPLSTEGILIRKTIEGFKQNKLTPENDMQVGYYHIRAHSIEQAVEIAKGNPEFFYIEGSSIEVRPIKTKEEETGFVYPSSSK